MHGLRADGRCHRPAAPSRRVRGVRAGGGEAGARPVVLRGGRRRAAACLRERRDARSASGSSRSRGRTMRASARCGRKAFVDASGEGDVAFFADAATRYGNDGIVDLGGLGTRFGGIPREVDRYRRSAWPRRSRPERGRSPDRSVMIRLPISGDAVCSVASADYDPRDAASFSAAEREWPRAGLDLSRCRPHHSRLQKAYLVSTGPEFGTRKSRHIEARLSAHLGRRGAGPARSTIRSRSAHGASNGTTARRSRAPSSIRRTRGPTRSPCAPHEPRYREPVRGGSARRCRPEGGRVGARHGHGLRNRPGGGRRRGSVRAASPCRWPRDPQSFTQAERADRRILSLLGHWPTIRGPLFFGFFSRPLPVFGVSSRVCLWWAHVESSTITTSP